MIPMAATIYVQKPSGGVLHLWIPLILLWLLLLPLALLISPLFLIACLVMEVSPFRVVRTFWQILSGLSGTQAEFRHERGHLLLRIS